MNALKITETALFNRRGATCSPMTDKAEETARSSSFPVKLRMILSRSPIVLLEQNPRRALSCIRELQSRCENLVVNAFAVAPRYEHHGIRRHISGNHLIFHPVDDAKVVIMHILHGASDDGATLFGE